MKVLVACEFSGVVRTAFELRGHDAWSCDVLPSEIPYGNHLQCDVLEVIHNRSWDLMIAHPPCTYLTVTGNRWFLPKYKDRYPDREKQREDAVKFFMALANAPIPRIAIENPVSVIASRWRKSDQVIQPYQFGDKAVKKTCLWLKNLPKLKHTCVVEPEYKIYNSSTKKSGKSRYPMLWTGAGKGMGQERSKTFPGIATAMANQWGSL
jgi:hypothetical protein